MADNSNTGGTSNIRISHADLEDPKLHRLNRKLDLMDSETTAAANTAVRALQQSTALITSSTPGIPVLTGISPSSGAQGATVGVSLVGGNFSPLATIATDNIDISVSAVAYVSPTKLTATFTIGAAAALGPASVTVSVGTNTTGAVIFLVTSSSGSGVLKLVLTNSLGQISVAFSGALQASGGAAPYTYAIDSGALPTGLSLDVSTGQISGTPSALGTFDFVGKTTDSAAATATYAGSITITETSATALSLVFGSWKGWQGIAYSAKVLVAAGGDPPYTYSLTGTMPPGLSLNASTGVVSGTPTTPGIYKLTAGVADSLANAATAAGEITIDPHVSLSLSNLNGQVDVPFTATLIVAGGAPPFTFSLLSGVLPPGLTFDAATGTISGTPTVAGVYAGIVFDVTDTNALSATTGSIYFNITTPDGSSVSLPLTSVTGRDMGISADTLDLSRSEVLKIGCAAIFTGGGGGGASIPAENCTAFLSRDAGLNYMWLGSNTWVLQGQETYFTKPRPSQAETWYLALAPGNLPGDYGVLIPAASLPSGYVLSSGFSVAGLVVSAVTAAEVAGSVYQDTTGGIFMELSVSAVIAAAVFPVRTRIWLDFGDSGGKVLQGDLFADSATPTWILGTPTQNTGVTVGGSIRVPTDTTKVNWVIYAEANSFDQQPSGAAASFAFAVTPAQACPATDCTLIQFVANPDTSEVIDYVGPDALGTYYWIWHEIDYYQPSVTAGVGASSDPNFKSSFVTVQKGWEAIGTGTVSGGTSLTRTAGEVFLSTDVGNEIHIGGLLTTIATWLNSTHVTLTDAVSNGSGLYFVWRPAPDKEGSDDPDAQEQGYRGRRFSDGPAPSKSGMTLAQIIGEPEWDIPPMENVDGSTNNYRIFRHRVYAVSRLGDNESGGTSTITLQTEWPLNADGSTDHGDLTPEVQAPALDFRQGMSRTLGVALGGGDGDNVDVLITGPLYADISNNLNIRIANDFVVTSVGGDLTLSQNIVNLALATNFGTEFTKSGGLLIVNAIAVNKLLAGDALFAGQATFAYSGGGKVTINSSGLTLADHNTSPNATVTIASTGATIAKGTNSVEVTASGVALKQASVTIVQLDSTGLTITKSGSVVVVDGTGFTVSKGSSSVQVTAGGVTIVNGILTSPTITITNGFTTINLDPTNYFKVSNSGSTFSVQISPGVTGPSSSTVDGYVHSRSGAMIGIGTFTAGGGLASISGPAVVPFSTSNAYSILDTQGLYVRGPLAHSAYVAYNSIGFNGVQVIGPKLGTRPVTLADVIAAGVTHGLWV